MLVVCTLTRLCEHVQFISRCFPELVVNLKLLNEAIPARLINILSSVFTYLLMVAAWSTSKFKSRQLFNKELRESSRGMLIYIRESAVFVVLISLGLYCMYSPFRILLSI